MLRLPETVAEVANTPSDVLTIVYAKGYIFAEGVHVESAVAPYLSVVDKRWIANRQGRDGKRGDHHITLVTKQEIGSVIKKDLKPSDVVRMFADDQHYNATEIVN